MIMAIYLKISKENAVCTLAFCNSDGRMAIQAGESITPCPQLVSVPLTGLERMLSSSLNMALSLPALKDFTCLTATILVVVGLARHFTIPRGVF
ncbi:hypothetical protein AVEN_3814-1 [Araneus ventricosus]|uniref:Uncharacterized protein n=1 Tax=Araneus ventricosus TaxID=182803 RepID=A0A4Y2HE47_ARAVE|nr:hypothetical protein AVEN_3814-1 [Araneus ventricosus]